MRKKLSTIIIILFAIILTLQPITSYAKASPKQLLKIMQSFKSNADIRYSVSMKKESGRYVYTINVKMKKISSGDVLISSIFAADSMNSVRKTFKNSTRDLYKTLRKYGIKGDIIMKIKSSNNILIWKFKNGKQIYCYY